MLFYAAAALVLWRKWAIYPLLVAFVAAWAARYVIALPVFEFLGNPIIIEFLAGIAIAKWIRPKFLSPQLTGLGLGILAVAYLAISAPPHMLSEAPYTLNGSGSSLRLIVWGIPAAALLVSFLSFEPYLNAAWSKLPVLLGDASYSIYLAHWPLLACLGWLLKKFSLSMSVYTVACMLFFIGIAGGFLLSSYIERPLRNAWRTKRLSAFLLHSAQEGQTP